MCDFILLHVYHYFLCSKSRQTFKYTALLAEQAEDIYDVAPTSTETVKDFSKLIGRFDQKKHPNSVRPVKPSVSLKPVQLPPKKSVVSPGPLSPGAIVSANLVNSARRQLSVVPNKRESCVRVSQYSSSDPQQSSGAPPVIPSKKKAAPPPIAEVSEPVASPPPQNGTTSIEHRPPPAVPVESVRPNSVRVSKLDTTRTPPYDNNTDKMKRVSKVSSQSVTYADVKHYKQLPVPVVNDPPPPKPSRPPNVELPNIDDSK